MKVENLVVIVLRENANSEAVPDYIFAQHEEVTGLLVNITPTIIENTDYELNELREEFSDALYDTIAGDAMSEGWYESVQLEPNETLASFLSKLPIESYDIRNFEWAKYRRRNGGIYFDIWEAENDKA